MKQVSSGFTFTNHTTRLPWFASRVVHCADELRIEPRRAPWWLVIPVCIGAMTALGAAVTIIIESESAALIWFGAAVGAMIGAVLSLIQWGIVSDGPWFIMRADDPCVHLPRCKMDVDKRDVRRVIVITGWLDVHGGRSRTAEVILEIARDDATERMHVFSTDHPPMAVRTGQAIATMLNVPCDAGEAAEPCRV